MYPMYVLMYEWLYEAWNGACLLAISYRLVLLEVSLDGDGDIAYHTLPHSTFTSDKMWRISFGIMQSQSTSLLLYLQGHECDEGGKA